VIADKQARILSPSSSVWLSLKGYTAAIKEEILALFNSKCLQAFADPTCFFFVSHNAEVRA